jgi:hypothetical protein
MAAAISRPGRKYLRRSAESATPAMHAARKKNIEYLLMSPRPAVAPSATHCPGRFPSTAFAKR